REILRTRRRKILPRMSTHNQKAQNLFQKKKQRLGLIVMLLKILRIIMLPPARHHQTPPVKP
ncbi:MAG: hypothetical protein IJG16_10700, partial [Clostridia bacterium]|nr:hypothetical protein [Clostridia bacterium]